MSDDVAVDPSPTGAATPVVDWEQIDATTLLVLLRRSPANALGLPLIHGLEAAMDHADQLPGLKAIVVASRVPGIFAAGADIKHMVTGGTEAFAEYGDALRPQVERFADPRRITIAAIDGLALGGGCELAMACTLRVAGSAARLGLPETRIGLIPGAGGTQRLPRLVGRGRALDLILTGRQISAGEAHAIGLVDRVCDEGAAEGTACDLARELGGLSQPALLAALRCVDASYGDAPGAGFAREVSESMDLFEHGEAREGLTAFVEKRPPRFS